MSSRTPRGRSRSTRAARQPQTRRSAARRVRATVNGRRAPNSEALPLDGGVTLSALLLLGTGLVMSYSSTAPLALDHTLPPLFIDHVKALAVGGIACFAAIYAPLHAFRALAIPFWCIAVLLLAATDLFGVEVNGAQRWLAIPGAGFRFQPVEIVKLATLLAVAAVVARREGRSELSPRRAGAAIAIVAVPLILLIRQPDFGNAVLLGALAALVLVAAGTPLKRLILPGLLAIGAIATYVATNAYAMRRVVGFLDPWKDAHGAGFQLVQSFVAFSKGGMLGVGLGAGRQKLSYLPEGHTDFILALIAEEIGLIGVLVVLGSFAALWIAGTRIARQSSDRFSLLLALAMTALLTVPAVINAAVVMGMLPTKGLTLPFLSHGGTSLVMSCTVLGVLLGVSRHREHEPRGQR